VLAATSETVLNLLARDLVVVAAAVLAEGWVRTQRAAEQTLVRAEPVQPLLPALLCLLPARLQLARGISPPIAHRGPMGYGEDFDAGSQNATVVMIHGSSIVSNV